MNTVESRKVTPHHLGREAYLDVRQSSLRQVVENTESTQRQYALRERAVALGWPPDRIVVVDDDLGQSGATAADRAGFQRLVTEVGLGRVGIVLGLEVSRLARNSTDWHRLLEICAFADTLILDEDGVYDPSDFNDRLVLGLNSPRSYSTSHCRCVLLEVDVVLDAAPGTRGEGVVRGDDPVRIGAPDRGGPWGVDGRSGMPRLRAM